MFAQKTVFPSSPREIAISPAGNIYDPFSLLESFTRAPVPRALYLGAADPGAHILRVAFPWARLTHLKLIGILTTDVARDLIQCPALEGPRYTSSSHPCAPPVCRRPSARCPTSAASLSSRPVHRCGSRARRAGVPALGVALAYNARAHGADAPALLARSQWTNASRNGKLPWIAGQLTEIRDAQKRTAGEPVRLGGGRT
ncbi:hypothetical protein DFH09DRAFT_1075798 [Mycena vulgaris]|nr:hypothetical protein DFH09DRAFT_1075798 [Mycena vulgaris]